MGSLTLRHLLSFSHDELQNSFPLSPPEGLRKRLTSVAFHFIPSVCISFYSGGWSRSLINYYFLNATDLKSLLMAIGSPFNPVVHCIPLCSAFNPLSICTICSLGGEEGTKLGGGSSEWRKHLHGGVFIWNLWFMQIQRKYRDTLQGLGSCVASIGKDKHRSAEECPHRRYSGSAHGDSSVAHLVGALAFGEGEFEFRFCRYKVPRGCVKQHCDTQRIIEM